MPSIYGVNTGCCGSGGSGSIDPDILNKFVFSDNKFPLNSGGAFLVKDGNAEDRKAITTTLTITQLEQDLSDIDTRLDALEALPSLPIAFTQNERLLWDEVGNEWIRDNNVALLGLNLVDNSESGVLVGTNITLDDEKCIGIGSNISGLAEGAICINTGDPVSFMSPNHIRLHTADVKLRVNNTGNNTDPYMLGTAIGDSENYYPVKFEDTFKAVYDTNIESSYLRHDGTDWVIGNEIIQLGTGAGQNTVGATYGGNNVFVGKNAGRASVATNLYQNTVCVGLDLATNNQTLTRDSVCIGRSINNIRPYSIGIGCYMETVSEGGVAIGRFSTNTSLNDRKVIGLNSIAIGRSTFDVPNNTIYIDANNAGTQTGSPDAGSINIIANQSQLVISEANVEASSRPVADGQRWGIVSTDGTNYQPTDISKIYKNQRMFWTHYTQIGGTPITQVINSTTDFNLFDAPTRRLEYSPDGGAVGGGTTWEYDSVNKVMIWNGADDTPVSIEVNVNIERINTALCVARLLPVYNGSEIGAAIEGNACQARLSRNSSTSLHLSFVLSLQNGDELSFLLRKVNDPSDSNIRILYSDVKIYGLRTNELADQVLTNP